VSRRFRSLLLLLLVIAVPATAHTFGFSIGTPLSPFCLSAGKTPYRLAAAGERADITVRIDPAASTPDIRIALAANADEADFVIVDDGNGPPRCAMRAIPRTVALDASAATPDIVVGIAGPSEPASYRIFVRSRFVSEEAAAALLAAGKLERTPTGAIASRRQNGAN
jgi:hypothetical protein